MIGSEDSLFSPAPRVYALGSFEMQLFKWEYISRKHVLTVTGKAESKLMKI